MIRSRLMVALGALLFLACSSDPEGPDETDPQPGTLLVTVSTTGSTLDPDGYSIELDGVEVERVG